MVHAIVLFALVSSGPYLTSSEGVPSLSVAGALPHFFTLNSNYVTYF